MKYYYTTEEVTLISMLASCIASDNLKSTETALKRAKKSNLDPDKIYEAILQSHLFCGFPAAIESLKLFSNLFPEYTPRVYRHNISLLRILGNHNCKLIYKNNFKKLISNINELSPDLKEWMITDGYGKVMGRKGLNLLEREFINISVLCTRFYENQLHSHLKGCLNLGGNLSDIKSVLTSLTRTAGSSNIKKSLKLLNKISKK
ncbi:MAG: carboxymuconolactone decarboxylase family protein [Bacteroidetes bacterium]|nr:carboxymuconolactone decarboxylase family protein [Bacteroidota bacterium]